MLSFKTGGILKQLRKVYPGDWKAVRDGFGWEWHGPIGIVRAYAQSAPKHDSDDESFITIYMVEGRQIGSCGIIYTSVGAIGDVKCG